MALTVYRSSDASAPVLSGQAGAFLAIVHACLVAGYGAKSGAGWARAFTGTNLGSYRAASGNRLYLAIDDTGAQEAKCTGYETMSAVATGTNLFPTAVQLSGGLFVRKSSTADSTARPWVLVATDVGFVFLPDSTGSDWLTAPTAARISGQFYFGDIVSFKPSDAFGTLIMGQQLTGDSNGRFAIQQQSTNWAASTGHYLARNQAQTAGAAQCSKRMALDPTLGVTIGLTGAAYPDPVSGGLLVSPIYILESAGGTGSYIRGRLPGLWGVLHNAPANHADTMDGSGDTSGRSFQLFNAGDAGNLGRMALEYTNTWYS